MSNLLETLNQNKFRVMAPAQTQEVLGGLAEAAGTSPTLMGGTFVGDTFMLDWTPDPSTGPAPSQPSTVA